MSEVLSKTEMPGKCNNCFQFGRELRRCDSKNLIHQIQEGAGNGGREWCPLLPSGTQANKGET